MRHYGLCLLIPPGWERLDGDPETIERNLDMRWADYHLTAKARSRLLAVQQAAAARAKAAGNILWATKHLGGGTPDDPLSVISLTVTVSDSSALEPPNNSERGPDPVSSPARVAAQRSAVQMRFPNLSGAVEERRTVEQVDDNAAPIPVFHAHAFVMPADRSAVVTVTVTTPDPRREAEARQAAVFVASALRFEPLKETTSQ